jgi:uncharacterized protein YqeY
MTSLEPDAAETTRQRLQQDLRLAMKRRQTCDVTVLRDLIAAIDNAGAVAQPSGEQPRQSEVERRRLDSDGVQGILRREYETRQRAASEFARLGRIVESERAAREMTVVSRYFSS